MNFIILNNEEYFRERINLPHFKEVSVNGRDRCDGVFGNITIELLEECSRDDGIRNQFFEKAGLYGDWGLEFIVFKIPQDILYHEKPELISECLKFINADNFCTQIWSYRHQNTWEYFLIGISKTCGIEYLYDVKIDAEDDFYGIQKICEKIENILF